MDRFRAETGSSGAVGVLGTATLAAVLAAVAVAVSGCAAPGTGTRAGAEVSQGADTAAPATGAVVLPDPSTWATGAVASPVGAGLVSSARPTDASTAAPPSSHAAAQVLTTAVPRCHTADLAAVVTIVPGSQQAGHATLNVRLVNVSGHTCTVYGYPGFQLRDINHDGQATTVGWDHAVPKRLITLREGHSAAATATLDDDVPAADEPKSGSCEPPSTFLAITPPDESTQLEPRIGGSAHPTPITVCEHGAIAVSAFVPGSTGPDQ